MKTMNKNIEDALKLTVSSFLALSLLQACGKSDATKDYQDLKLVHLSADKAKNQELLTQVFSISVVSDGAVEKIPDFFEGEANEFKIKLNIADPEITLADLSIDQSTKPDGSTLTKTKEDPNTYVFRWTPPVGYINPGASRTADVSFVAHVINGPAIIQNFIAVKDVKILVQKSQTLPKVLGFEIPESIDEGQDQLVKIKVQDMAHSQVNQPDLNIVSYKGAQNNENHKFDWAANVTPDQPLIEGPDKDGVFKYRFILHTKNIKLPTPPSEFNPKKADANASIVNLCFSAIAKSKVSGLEAKEPSDICTRVRFAAQPPVVYFDGDPDGNNPSTDVVAGAAMSLGFEVKTQNSRGNIEATKAAFPNFKSTKDGKPKIEEIANPKDASAKISDVSSDRFYKMTWTPDCKASGAYVLNLKMTSNVDGQKKSLTVTRKLNIISKSEVCNVPQTPSAPKAPVKK